MNDERKKTYAVVKFNKLTGQLERPTLLLRSRTGRVIGEILYTNLQFSFVGKGLDEISFDIHKIVNGKECKFWDNIIDLCIIDYVGYGLFEASISTIDENETIKTAVCESLETELGQCKLRDFHVNDEDAIVSSTDATFLPTVLYDQSDEDHSLLCRVLKEKAPHWSVGEVSELFNVDGYVYHSNNLQRTFTVDKTAVYDFLDNDVSIEFSCIFTYDTYNRKVNCYNLEECVYEKKTMKVMDGYYYIDGTFYTNENQPITGTNENLYGYCPGLGEDTSIFLSKAKLSRSFNRDSDKGSIKNCFYVTGGDDTINNIVAAANVTGNNYIYLFGNFQYEDMGEELTKKITEYAAMLEKASAEFTSDGGVYIYRPDCAYNKNTGACIDKNGKILTAAKNIGEKVYVVDSLAYYKNGKGYDKDDNALSDYFYEKGGLFTQYTQALDRKYYLEHNKFPNITTTNTTANTQQEKIKNYFNEHTIIIQSGCTVTYFTHVTSTIETMIGVVCDSRYKISILSDAEHISTCDGIDKDNQMGEWKGTVRIARETDESDYSEFYLTVTVQLALNTDDNIAYCKQKMDIAIAKMDIAELDFTTLSNDGLRNLLNQYNLVSLKSFMDGFDSCRTTLTDLYNNLSIDAYETDENGDIIQDKNGYNKELPVISESYVISRNRYTERYNIAKEIYDKRHAEVQALESTIESLNGQIVIFRQNLDIKKHFGEKLWKQFQSYIREDDYNNPNYISDGLSDSELLLKSKDLLEAAKTELSNACMIQYKISGNLNNIFAVSELESLYLKFNLFNYVRAEVDDKIYKLRMTEIRFSDQTPDSLDVTFSETVESVDGKISDVKKILENSQSIATTYSSTAKQAKQGAAAMSNFDDIQQEGLNSALYLVKNSNNEETTIDRRGISCRSMLDEGVYSDNMLQLTSNGMYLTKDAWKSVCTAIGRFKYNGEWVYGVNTELLIGKMIVGENLLITNSNGSVSITGDGIVLDGGSINWKKPMSQDGVSGLTNALDTIHSNIEQLDGRIQTYSQEDDPKTTPGISWDDSENDKHKGDIWVKPSTGITYIYTLKNGVYVWEETNDSTLATLAAGKSTIFTSKPVTADKDGYLYKKNDMWILESDYTLNGIKYDKGCILTAKQDSPCNTTGNNFRESDWIETNRYGGLLDDLADDGKLTASEKQQLNITWLSIQREYDERIQTCENESYKSKIDETIYGNYKKAYAELKSYLSGENGLLNSLTTTSDINSHTFNTKFDNYNLTKEALDKIIAETIAETKASTVSEKGIEEFQKKVAGWITGDSTTVIDSTSVFAPYIGGGYGYWTNGDYSVEIDPNHTTKDDRTKNGYLFCIRDKSKSTDDDVIMGVDTDGDGYFKGTVYATDGYFSGKLNSNQGSIGSFNLSENGLSNAMLKILSDGSNNASFSLYDQTDLEDPIFEVVTSHPANSMGKNAFTVSRMDEITLSANDICLGNEKGNIHLYGEININDTNLSDMFFEKVDKISGKGLSTNDYTTAEKNKLANLVSPVIAMSSESFAVDKDGTLISKNIIIPDTVKNGNAILVMGFCTTPPISNVNKSNNSILTLIVNGVGNTSVVNGITNHVSVFSYTSATASTIPVTLRLNLETNDGNIHIPMLEPITVQFRFFKI